MGPETYTDYYLKKANSTSTIATNAATSPTKQNVGTQYASIFDEAKAKANKKNGSDEQNKGDQDPTAGGFSFSSLLKFIPTAISMVLSFLSGNRAGAVQAKKAEEALNQTTQQVTQQGSQAVQTVATETAKASEASAAIETLTAERDEITQQIEASAVPQLEIEAPAQDIPEVDASNLAQGAKTADETTKKADWWGASADALTLGGNLTSGLQAQADSKDAEIQNKQKSLTMSELKKSKTMAQTKNIIKKAVKKGETETNKNTTLHEVGATTVNVSGTLGTGTQYLQMLSNALKLTGPWGLATAATADPFIKAGSATASAGKAVGNGLQGNASGALLAAAGTITGAKGIKFKA